MKKGEVQQVFTYIMVLLIVGTILLIGVRSIGNIMGKACDVDEARFKQEIEDLMSRNSRYGNVGYETIRVPCDYDEICFTGNLTDDCEIDNGDSTLTNDQIKIIKNECDIEGGNNVFIKRGQIIEPLFAIDNLRVDTAFCVTPRGGNYYVRMEGVGRGLVEIKEDTV